MNHPNRSKLDPSPSRNPKPEEITALRESCSLSPEQAAALIYVSPRTLAQYETGEKRMHPGLFELLRIKAKPAE